MEIVEAIEEEWDDEFLEYGVPRSPVDTFVDWKSSRVRVDSRPQ
jgi:hypothetical protein